MIKNSIGNILKEARERNGLTQQQLADKYLSPRQLISNYERGKSLPSVDGLILLLDILNTYVSIKDGEVKIMEVKSMNNLKENARDLRIEYLNFNLENLLKKHSKQKESVKNDCIKKYEEIVNLAKNKDLEVYHGYGFTDDMWHMDYSKDGIAFSISKDDKEIQVEVEKSSYLEIFDLDTFTEDIKVKYGEGVSKEIFKIVTFSAYTYNLGKDIFNLFKNISQEFVSDIKKISELLPMLKEFEDIIFNQLTHKNYVIEIYELTLDKNNISVSYLLDIYDEYQSNNLWIKLILDDYEVVYEPESFDNGVIVDACEYAVNIFDKFDELFEESKQYM